MAIAGLIFLPLMISFFIWSATDTMKRKKNGTDNGMFPLVNSIFLGGFSLVLFIGCLLSVLGFI